MRYLIFIVAALLSWWPFMVVHELGHIASGLINSATIEAIELRPWRLSYTMLSGSKRPLVDIWAGVVIGGYLPLVLLLVPTGRRIRKGLTFFAGFCLIANGVYIGIGWLGPYGDTKEMMQMHTPVWVMIVFSLVSCTAGLWLWSFLDRGEK